eukprot:354537-Chlamydomonas_euryale.AAC.3
MLPNSAVASVLATLCAGHVRRGRLPPLALGMHGRVCLLFALTGVAAAARLGGGCAPQRRARSRDLYHRGPPRAADVRAAAGQQREKPVRRAVRWTCERLLASSARSQVLRCGRVGGVAVRRCMRRTCERLLASSARSQVSRCGREAACGGATGDLWWCNRRPGVVQQAACGGATGFVLAGGAYAEC